MNQLSTLYYTKHFVSGCLKGISIIEHFTFDKSRIDEITKFVNRGKYGRPLTDYTGNKYNITDAAFQNYAR
jgi:hypothetical protein